MERDQNKQRHGWWTGKTSCVDDENLARSIKCGKNTNDTTDRTTMPHKCHWPYIRASPCLQLCFYILNPSKRNFLKCLLMLIWSSMVFFIIIASGILTSTQSSKLNISHCLYAWWHNGVMIWSAHFCLTCIALWDL